MSSRVLGIEAQQRIVNTIERLHADLGYWPSQQLVREALKMPRSTARYHILLLVGDGRLERLENGRILRVVQPAKASA